jgi:hypothetical protein
LVVGVEEGVSARDPLPPTRNHKPPTASRSLDTTAATAILTGMIRRHEDSDWFLITQDDHARLAGELAAHVGNHLFERPQPNDSFVKGATLHDCGWSLHDDEPTLNPAGQPLDVFETTPAIGVKVWSASAERAAAADDRAGLLVSLHSLALSVNATTPTTQTHEKFDLNNPTARFEVNKFQHRQVELQESLRRRMGLATDLPLRQGLAIDSELPAEQEIVFQFHLLQAMDNLSLAICCTKPPAAQIRPVLARPGGRSLSLRVRRTDDQTLYVSPWPFDVDQIRVDVPFLRLPAEPFSSEENFRKAYAAALPERFTATILPRR